MKLDDSDDPDLHASIRAVSFLVRNCASLIRRNCTSLILR